MELCLYDQNYCHYIEPLLKLPPTLSCWDRDKMDTSWQTTFSHAFSYENAWISITISLIFFPKARIGNRSAFIKAIVLRRTEEETLTEQMTT